MPLILAVEPDRRQAAHLTHVVRQRVGAELILAETTELALASIGNRVPDLILVPALLSPTDDAALAAALRVIATAAHVQMLTTPLFATAAPAPRRGVLAAFRRSKPAAPSIDGCDPAEFAQQISSYLESAAEERAAAVQYAEAPVQAPQPVAETSQRYVPLEAGRLYRDEAVAYRQIETAPATEPIPEPAITLPESEPVVQFDEPIAELEADPVLAVEAEPVVAFEAEPVVPFEAEPVVPFEAEPVVAFEADPVVAFEAEPAIAFEADPIVAFEAEPLIDEAGPAIYEPIEAVSETPDTETIAEPVATLQERIFETPAPLVEIPEPLAAAEPIHSRRIGFVVHAEEAEPVEVIAEPFVVEAAPVEIAATVETADATEEFAEIAAQESVAAFAEPVVVEQEIELLEVVDDDPDADGAFDLSADFDVLQVVDAQSDAEETVSLEAFDVGAVEIATDETEAIEILETPEIVDAFEPAVPQLHVVRFDALTEFAAAVEAMTAAVPIAAASQPQAVEAIEFDDLFPRREPVEPSPLGAWRSWTTLEGMTAEASDAPVPAHVVERAVERAVDRAPERPEWVQLVESLRIDVERRRSEQPAAAPKPVRKTPSRPIQDEWGLFDPAQCGFAALLEKLDEITDTNESRPRRSA